MEFLRYMIVFAALAVGGAVGGTMLTLLLSPLFNRFRDTDNERIVVASLNGFAVLVVVWLASWLCARTGADASAAMFVLPFVAMVLNDWERVGRSRKNTSLVDVKADDEPRLRDAVLRSNVFNLVGDVVGFCAGLLLLLPLRWY